MDDYYQYMRAIADGGRTGFGSPECAESTFNPQFTERVMFQGSRSVDDVSLRPAVPGDVLEPDAKNVYDRHSNVITYTPCPAAPFQSTSAETSMYKTGEGYLFPFGNTQKETNTTDLVGNHPWTYGGVLCGSPQSEAIGYKSYTLANALQEPEKTPPVSTAPPPAVPPTRDIPPVALPALMAQPTASPPQTILLTPSAHPAAIPVGRVSKPTSAGHQERPTAKRKASRKPALKSFLRQPLRKIAPKPSGSSGGVRMN